MQNRTHWMMMIMKCSSNSFHTGLNDVRIMMQRSANVEVPGPSICGDK
jgi:hypothetical protein